MSYLPPNEENENAPQGQTTNNPTSSMPPPVSGGSTGAGASAPKQGAGAAPNTATPTQFGSSASQLQSYLTANAPQITQEGAQIAGNLNQGYGQVSGDINNAVNQFGQTVAGGYAAPNQSVDQQAAANPTGFASNPNNVSAFQGQYNDTYTGPSSFETTTPYSNIQSEVSNAVQDAGSLSTPAGLQNYFAQQEQNPTTAETTLDSLLLSGNPTANQQVQTAAGQYANLTPQLTAGTTTADAGVAAAQSQAQQAQQAAQQAINPVVANENTNLQNELTTDQAAANTYNQNTGAAQNEATQINQILNEEPQIFQNVPNYNLSQFLTGLGNPVTSDLSLTPYSTPATQANTATTQDYATTQALSNLLGTNYQDPLSQNNVAQAGTFNVPTNGVTQTGVTQNLAQWLEGNELPAVQYSENALTNPSPGSDPAAAKQEAEQQQFISDLEAVAPGLTAALNAPQTGINSGDARKIS